MILRSFAQRRSCQTFWHWLIAWWDSGPWHLRYLEPFDRCVMGGPVDDSVHCRRPIVAGMWCKRHQPGPDEEEGT